MDAQSVVRRRVWGRPRALVAGTVEDVADTEPSHRGQVLGVGLATDEHVR